MSTKKWLVRGGALLVTLGFIMPTMLVSCGGPLEYGQTVSLYELTSLTDSSLLYLVPLGAIAVMILAFLPTINNEQKLYFFWGKVSGAVIGLLSMLITLSALKSQVAQVGFEVSPKIGALILAAGYGIIAVGLFQEWPEIKNIQRKMPGLPWEKLKKPIQSSSPPPWLDPSARRDSYSDETAPEPFEFPQMGQQNDWQSVSPGKITGHLNLIKGNLPQSTITLHDNFKIGRGSGNDLFLEDRTVSRQHACLRYAQGTWFIQDMESTVGTYVNEISVPATRLEDGDQIQIGSYLFVFRNN